jgi:cytochrome b pre-mRNA-processing protein 3
MPFLTLNLFDRWRARRELKARVEDIHGEIVAAARAPELYAAFSAPDDMDGRFEMVVLHASLLLRRLNDFGAPGRPLAQELVDRLFVGFDDALREMSVSDAGVRRRVRAFAEAFFGRAAVYHAALETESARALAEALARNVYRGQVGPDALGPRLLTERVLAQGRAFEAIGLEVFLEGRFRYPTGQGGTR